MLRLDVAASFALRLEASPNSALGKRFSEVAARKHVANQAENKPGNFVIKNSRAEIMRCASQPGFAPAPACAFVLHITKQ
jgi:hypothetical protein